LLRSISDLDDLQYYGKRVLVRVDFNVSIRDGIIGEDYRIRMAIPTIEYLAKRGAKVILASHLGRPNFRDPTKSLEPVAKRLGEILGSPRVSFASECVGDTVLDKINKLTLGDIVLLENLRYHQEEENNDRDFCKNLADLADIYVNDAFSTSHRRHASTFGSAEFFDIRLAGFSLKKEFEYLSMIKENPQKPFTLVVGGSKIKDKIGALENLLPKANKLLVGGAAAYTFLKAKGIKTGNSQIDEEHFPWVSKALGTYGDKIFLPNDHIISSSPTDTSFSLVEGDIPDDMIAYDIGNETSRRFSTEVGGSGSGTVFWNGPMGMFEVGQYANGTINIAKSMALAFWRGTKTLVGGGDTLEAMKTAGVAESEVSHVSTGGGATLKFLAGDGMPGVQVIQTI
jgi:phosphoglycerate kinase